MKTQHSSSLRCQAHWQNTQSQRYDQILPKSRPALPTLPLGLKDNAAKIKDKNTEDKNGQLVTGGCCQWRDSASYDSAVHIETLVLRGKFSSEIATEQQPPGR